jgi:hypothetical protein
MKLFVLTCIFVMGMSGFVCAEDATTDKPGLIGAQYGSLEFERVQNVVPMSSLEVKPSDNYDFGNDWSARWFGTIVAPASGMVEFSGQSSVSVELKIAGKTILTMPSGSSTGSMTMEKGKEYPIELSVVKEDGMQDCVLNIQWSWAGGEKVTVPGENLRYSAAKEQELTALKGQDDDDDDDDDDDGVLAGIIFDSTDFTNPRDGLDVLPSLDLSWGADMGKDWSARWIGGLNGTYFGDVTFTAETNGKVRIIVAGYVVIDTLTKDGPNRVATRMAKDGGDWMQIEFVATQSPAYLRVYWEWPGQPKAIVFNDEMDYDEEDVTGYGEEEGDGGEFDDDDISDLLPRFTGGQPYVVDMDYHDGQVRPIVGTHNFEVMRSNRTHPELSVKDVPYYPENGYKGDIGFMYNHAPMICYWKDLIWLYYRSGPTNEHEEPCYNLITWSKDGRNWVKPETIFPAKIFKNQSKDGKMQYSIAHQRAAFYVTKSGRLLVSGFYGMPSTPNGGNGVGRAIREVYSPGKYGPIYWVRLNSHQKYTKDNVPHFPFYKKAKDKGFVECVDELLANNLMVQQWFEEERDDAGKNCALVPEDDDNAKAFNWYTLPDGRIVGMWKGRWMALADKWERGFFKAVGHGRNIYYSGAKIWGQRTSDGRYALAYNSVVHGRTPLTVTTSDDGMNFDTYFLNAHGEAPPTRFGGHSKDGGGSGYVRGIIPGNGVVPDNAMWLTYSSNKEDIWITRLPVPIKGTVRKDVIDDFEDMEPGGIVTNWNIYSGVWTPINVAKDKVGKFLRLEDKDPYEYAKAVRVFPEGTLKNLSFKLRAQQKGKDDLEIEVLNYKGQRPVRIKLEGGRIKALNGSEFMSVGSFKAGQWIKFDISVDTVTGVYDLKLNDKQVVSDAKFAVGLTFEDRPYGSKFRMPTVERIEFRTGAYRLTDFSRYGSGDNGCLKGGGDLPGADDPVANAVFDIDDFCTSGFKQ